LPSGATFCTKCGAILSEEFNAKKDYDLPYEKRVNLTQSKTLEPPAEMSSDLKKCPDCDRNVGKAAKLCTYCGHMFPIALKKVNQAKLEQDEKKKLAIGQSIRDAIGSGDPAQARRMGKPKSDVITPKVAESAVPPRPTPQPAKGQKPEAKADPSEQKAQKGKAPTPAIARPKPSKPSGIGAEIASEGKKEKGQPKPQKPKDDLTEREMDDSFSLNDATSLVEEPIPEIPEEPEQQTPPENGAVTRIDEPDEQEDAKQIEKLRASRIEIKEKQVTAVKIKDPIPVPEYDYIECSPVPPFYPEQDFDPDAIEIPEDMVLVKKGPFLFGPEMKEKSLGHFLIDKYPVTCGQYLEFCEQTNYPKPWDWAHKTFVNGRQDHPVTFVSHNDAMAYAQWKDKRIPTELEWEKAAGGFDGRKYPWGSNMEADRCHFKKHLPNKITTRIDKFPEGISPFGCFDMAGNTAEITEPAPYREEPPFYPILKGGSFMDPENLVTCRIRILFTNNDVRKPFIGFRCAKDIVISQ